MGHILLVADRKTTIDSLVEILADRGEHNLIVASNQRRALQLARQLNPELIIVDLTSAKLSGGKICFSLRKQTETPILAIVREPPADGAAPLAADEWLIKPFSAQSLLSQAHRLLYQSQLLMVGDVALDLRMREVRVAQGPPIRLPPKQFALLRCLMMRPGEALTRAQLMREVWETDFLDDTRTLDVHIRWLREKIEPNPGAPVYIQTIRRVGYRFVPRQ